jgi:hypothetical protein
MNNFHSEQFPQQQPEPAVPSSTQSFPGDINLGLFWSNSGSQPNGQTPNHNGILGGGNAM